MTIIFMGTPEFSVPSARTVHEEYGIDLVVTQPSKKKGRSGKIVDPPMKTFADSHNIPVLQPKRLHAVMDEIIAMNPDLIITAAYGQILPKRLLEIPSFGAINVHASLLPKLRGGAPIQRAIERGHEYTGITIMYMAEKMDAGDIIATKRLQIEKDDTGGSLFEKLAHLGSDLLEDVLPSIFNNEVKATPQDESEATYAYNIKPEEEKLDFETTASANERKVRAFHPEPSTYLTVDGERVKVLKAEVVESDGETPGRVVDHRKEGIVIQCKDDGLLLKEVQPSGRKAMDGASFLNGKGKTLLPIGKKIDD